MRPRLTYALLLGMIVAALILSRRPSGTPGGVPGTAPAAEPYVQGVTINIDSIRGARRSVIRRIANSDTYLGAMLAAGDSALRRWSQRIDDPIDVYFPEGGAPGHTPEHDRVVRGAFRRWQRGAEIPVAFRFVRDSSGAEVHVRWIDRFQQRRTGQADVVWSPQGWMVRGTLTLATHSRESWQLSTDAVYTVALHEIGHLLGLGHSDDPADLMYPSTSVHDLTLRDMRTADLLYALPPGSLRDPVASR